jgi:hypothetical protein
MNFINTPLQEYHKKSQKFIKIHKKSQKFTKIYKISRIVTINSQNFEKNKKEYQKFVVFCEICSFFVIFNLHGSYSLIKVVKGIKPNIFYSKETKIMAL